jgi:hypothetical protein
MANKIILKKSSVAAKVPLSTDLDVGEIAVNLVDQKLYSKKADGTVVLVGNGIAGAGDVVGAASSTDNAITRFDGTTGKLIQNSAVIIDDSNNVTGVNSFTAATLVVNDNATLGGSNTDNLAVNARITTDLDPATNNARDIGTSGRNWRDGFFGRTLSTVNLELTGTTSFDGSQGTSGQVLTSAGTGNTPTWTTPATGTVTAVTGTAPVVSSGGATPVISMAAATTSVNGYLTSTDWNTFNNKTSNTGTVTSVGGTGTVNGITLTGTVTTSGSLTLGGTLSGVNLTTQVTGTLPATNGGTGQSTYAVGDILIGGATNTLAKLADVATGNALISGGVGVAPSYGKVGLTTHVSGTLPIANGGTGATTRQEAIDALAGAVTSGQYLRGNGTDVVMSAIQAADVPTLNQSTTGSAATLTTGRNINGTSFNGSADITTANWGTARTLWGQSVNGSANITAPLLPAAGTAALPAFSTSGDTNTGVFFPAADTIGFAVGGTDAIRINSTGLILNAASGGSVTLVEQDTASNVVVTIPATTGTLLTNNSTGYRYVQTLYFTSSGTFSKATYPWLRGIRVRCVGGGGGGGGVGATSAGTHVASGGGGGGGYAESFITDIAGLAASVTITSGAGGAGGAAGVNNGATGGNSSFGSAVIGNGGGSGGGQTAQAFWITSASGGGGSGTGDLVIVGGGGASGNNVNNNGGYGGVGGTTVMGMAPVPTSAWQSSSAGTNGNLYGVGGSGAASSQNATAKAGGNGAAGIVIVDLFA